MNHSGRPIRRQLSLYVPPHAGVELEAARLLLDPVQSRLIPAHVTLCREDELVKVSEPELQARLADTRLKPVTLHFGRPEVFDGHGVLLACIAGEQDFRALREHVLGTSAIRRQAPHITLAHPRNPRSPDNCLSNTAHLPEVTSVTFSSICFIEQRGNEPWRVLQEILLQGS
jgi:2'-5' RNA ligase